jgi:hypothetical protein
MEQLFARHGDLVINQAAIPESVELKQPTAPVILAGRESAPHAIADFGSVLYGRSEAIQFVRVIRDVELSHSERHKTIALPAGDYQIASLAEMNGDLARSVED